MGQQPFRLTPALGAEHMKTYALAAPLATHTRPATCAEVDCEAYLNGWITRLPWGSPMVEALKASGRRYAEVTGMGAAEREFLFNAGQPCFRASTHRVPLERDAIYLVKGGDWRGNPRGTPLRRHARAEHWVEDFGEHQLGVAAIVEKG
jgi:hypothetical protein